jgi:hypothetical protein
MAMGILVATGAARDARAGGPRFAEPIELARVPTYQVLGVIARRTAATGRRGLARTVRRR